LVPPPPLLPVLRTVSLVCIERDAPERAQGLQETEARIAEVQRQLADRDAEITRLRADVERQRDENQRQLSRIEDIARSPLTASGALTDGPAPPPAAPTAAPAVAEGNTDAATAPSTAAALLAGSAASGAVAPGALTALDESVASLESALAKQVRHSLFHGSSRPTCLSPCMALQ